MCVLKYTHLLLGIGLFKCVNLSVHIDCSQIEGLNNPFSYLVNLFFPSLYLLNKEAWKVNFVLPNVPS